MVILTTAKSKDKIQTILDQSDGIAVLDFVKRSNSLCSELQPFAEQLNAQHDIPLIHIDVDTSPDLYKQFLVDQVPTFVVVKKNWNNIVHMKQCKDKEDVRRIFDTAMNNKETLI